MNFMKKRMWVQIPVFILYTIEVYTIYYMWKSSDLSGWRYVVTGLISSALYMQWVYILVQIAFKVLDILHLITLRKSEDEYVISCLRNFDEHENIIYATSEAFVRVLDELRDTPPESVWSSVKDLLGKHLPFSIFIHSEKLHPAHEEAHWSLLLGVDDRFKAVFPAYQAAKKAADKEHEQNNDVASASAEVLKQGCEC